jgi:hypothetical protein
MTEQFWPELFDDSGYVTIQSSCMEYLVGITPRQSIVILECLTKIYIIEVPVATILLYLSY